MLEIHTLAPINSNYPASLANLPKQPTLFYCGDIGILKQPLLAIFSSIKCPARLILKTHDLAIEFSASDRAITSGFQSPAEKEMLEVLLRGNSPLIICPARGLEGIRVPALWGPKINKGQLLVISPFPGYLKRSTTETVQIRNRLVAQVASEVLIIHAEPGGKVSALAEEIRAAGKQVRFL